MNPVCWSTHCMNSPGSGTLIFTYLSLELISNISAWLDDKTMTGESKEKRPYTLRWAWMSYRSTRGRSLKTGKGTS